MKNVVLEYTDKGVGIQKVDIEWPDSPIMSYHPQLFLCDRAQLEQVSSQTAGKSLKGILRQGVYLLIWEKAQSEGFNVFAGTHDFENNKTLLDCIISQAQEPNPLAIKDWEKAVVVCDWRDDISIAKIGSVSNSIEDDKKARVISEESAFIREMIYEILGNDISNIQKRGVKSQSCIANPAINRYNHYLYSVFHIIEKKFPNFFTSSSQEIKGEYGNALPKMMLHGKVGIGEKLYGKHNSEATVVDLNGFIRLDKYDNSKSNASNSLSKIISMNQAIIEICNSNQQENVGYLDFWSIKRSGEEIRFKDL